MKRIFILGLVAAVSLTVFAHKFEVANADGKTIYYNDVSESYGSSAAEVTFKGTWYGEFENNYADTIVIPNDVTYNGKKYVVVGIGEQAFSICHNLRSVTIPDSIKYIRDKAFKECCRLSQVNYNAVKCADLSMQEYAPFSISNLYWQYELDTVYRKSQIPDWGFMADSIDFTLCRRREYAISELNIGAQVERVPSFMFYGMGGYVYNVDYTPFNDHFINTGQEVWDSVKIYDSITGIRKINFKGVPKEIGNQAFRGCYGLTEVTIPAGVEKLGEAVFAECDTLLKATILASISALPSYTFMNCSKLREVNLPNSVLSVNYQSFKGCKKLSSITLPTALTTIGPSAFQDCDQLTSINYPTTLAAIDGYAFSRCTNLDNITFPASTKTIGNYAFEDCTNLTSIAFEGTPKEIGNFVFSGCRNLDRGTVNAPRLMPQIKKNTFFGVANTMTVLVDDDVRATYAADPYWGRFFAPTDLEEVAGKEDAQKNKGIKTLKNGNLLIQKGDKFFNVLGQEVPAL